MGKGKQIMKSEDRNGKRMTATRRGFLQAASVASVFWIPATRLFGQALPPLRKQGRIAVIGAGGIGNHVTENLKLAGWTLAAFCDTDESRTPGSRKHAPGAPFFTDYREMLEKCGKDFDAVAINTPDHTHAYIAIDCLKRGYHMLLQKPMAPTFEECEMIGGLAREKDVVFQLCNQCSPGKYTHRILRDRQAWGEIKSVEAWCCRPSFRKKMEAEFGTAVPTVYPKTQPWDSHFNARTWDLWCGPAPDHGYNGTFFAPYAWRLWWDYGTSGLGDMGIHNMDPLVDVLELWYPYSITAYVNETAGICHSDGCRVEFKFKPNKWVPNGITLTWRDGANHLPQDRTGFDKDFQFHVKNGVMVRGSELTTYGDAHFIPPTVIAEAGKDWGPSGVELRKKWLDVTGPLTYPWKTHFEQFLKAYLAGEPKMCNSNIGYSVPFSEMLCLGLIGTRFPGKEMLFDWKAKRFTNLPEANAYLSAPKGRGQWNLRKLIGA